MRLLFLQTTPFCPNHFSEQNQTLLELGRKLTTLGHETILLTATSQPDGHKKIVLDKQFGFRLFRAARPLEEVATLCASTRPDILVCVDRHKRDITQLAKAVDIPVAVWFFQTSSSCFQNRQPDKHPLYLASSPFLATRLANLYNINAQVVFPYIEKKNYHTTRQGEKVLFVNPTREKGVEILFQLARQRPKQLFRVVESGQISEQWRAVCFEQALECGNIEWLTATYDMQSVMNRVRLLLVPRFSEEGFCRLITEAQLGRIPVLSSTRGYLPTNTNAGGAVLDIDSGIDIWLAQMDRFFNDDTYYQNACNTAQNHALRQELDSEHVIRHLLTLLTEHISKFRLRRFSRLHGRT